MNPITPWSRLELFGWDLDFSSSIFPLILTLGSCAMMVSLRVRSGGRVIVGDLLRPQRGTKGHSFSRFLCLVVAKNTCKSLGGADCFAFEATEDLVGVERVAFH